ncbi:hypothetical protein ASAC_0076 [Acidilobus saccharovorans 345-15]|uniref:Uncharacterized protein n=1 Tax=Acidilobus saccharovorans (strain DSM 16705 / JCM 18335 / VKM B-2471 / 345-15) TaxID=666510 RepID=D9PZJ6_ACIS3|nr:hypothetical protein [Acidilobus saccharovorans]ADL18484.1 hypothetical protein ASAC_0076 [Acidilobus saccharovorans 345-15]
MIRWAVLLIVIAAVLLPVVHAQVEVSYVGAVEALSFNVTSAPQLLKLPLCAEPYSYAAYEQGVGSLYAEYSNGTLQVSVLSPGTVNVSVYLPPAQSRGRWPPTGCTSPTGPT